MKSFFRVTVSVFVVLTLFTLTLPTQAQPGPLWIAESQAVLELDRYSGVERSRESGRRWKSGARSVSTDSSPRGR